MKQKGFTLIELLCAIGIMAMLATILVPIVAKRINSSKEKSLETMIESIELAAETYVTEYGDTLQQYNQYDNIYISIETLVDNKYFDKSLINKTTDEPILMSSEVYVTRNYKGKIVSKYDIDQNTKTKIVLNEKYNIYIKKGELFVDPGVTATTPEGTNVSLDVSVSGTVDVNTLGNYVLEYTYQNQTIERNVIVVN